MLLATWNVNSLKARMDRVLEFLEAHRPDVVCLQETKCTADAFPHLALQAAGYVAADHSGGRWAGVAILGREDAPPQDVQVGLPGSPCPEEARWVEATVNGVRVVSVYVVNGRSILDPMFAIKLAYLDRMRERATQLAGGPLVLAGDFNIAPRDEDVYDPVAFRGSTHVTPDERDRLRALLDTGLHDAWDATPERGPHEFTWWDYRAGNFHKNKGLRIDLVLVSDEVASGLEFVGIDRDFRKGSKPSDHAPLLVRTSTV